MFSVLWTKYIVLELIHLPCLSFVHVIMNKSKPRATQSSHLQHPTKWSYSNITTVISSTEIKNNKDTWECNYNQSSEDGNAGNFQNIVYIKYTTCTIIALW
jgi:hypothetical protein